MTTNPLTGKPFSSRYWEIQEALRHRPILAYKEPFLKALDENQILVVTGDVEKSTQVPQWCLEYVQRSATTGKKALIGCTQPRRSLAVALARQVADQIDSPIGDHVGYSIRFEERKSQKTFLKYCTDGLLLREMIHSLLLESYQIIVVDEAQERTIGTDILLSMLKGITKQRKDLKVVVMSSSGDTCKHRKLQQYLDGCPVMEVGENKTGIAEKSPEILRVDLGSVVLQLKKLGVNDLSEFDFFTSPPREGMEKAIGMLIRLGALEKNGKLTETGTKTVEMGSKLTKTDSKLTEMGSKMAEFPLEPRLSRVLLASAQLDCTDEILSIVAMLSVPHHFISIKKRFVHPSGDHLTLLRIFHDYKANNDDALWCQENGIDYEAIQRADQIRSQLAAIQEKLNLTQNNPNKDPSNIQKALLTGHCIQLAHLGSDAKYRTLQDDKIVHLDSSTSLDGHPKWVIYNELTAENSIKIITEVEREWIIEMVPDLLIDRPATNDD